MTATVAYDIALRCRRYARLSTGAKSEFEETLVELGATVTVAGTLAKQMTRPDEAAAYRDTDPPVRIVGTKERPIAITLERVSNLAAEP